MSYYGVDIRNSLPIGLGGIISLLSSSGSNLPLVYNALLMESNDFLLQEDNGLILLEN
jgi:hypothetical protein